MHLCISRRFKPSANLAQPGPERYPTQLFSTVSQATYWNAATSRLLPTRTLIKDDTKIMTASNSKELAGNASPEASSAWKILIANAWGGNRGDEAMINTLFRLCTSVEPEVVIDVAPYRNEDLDIDEGMRVLRNHIGEYWYASVPPRMRTLLHNRIPRKVMRLLTTFLHRVGALAPRALVKPYDLIISAPQGPTLGDMYGAKERTIEPLRIAQQSGIPYMLLAISAGPFDSHSSSDTLVEQVLAGARSIVVREEVSQSHLKKKFPNLGNIECAIDIVYALPWSLTRKPEAHARKYSDALNEVGQDFIGACISMTPARKPTNPFDREAYIAQFIELADHVVGSTGRNLLLFPHLAFDMPALEAIRKRARSPQRIHILPPELDSDFHRDAVAKSAFFISSRYHPTIFAVQASVPFMCIKNQFKVEGMLEKIGLGGIPAVWQDESLQSFVDCFNACWNERDNLRTQVSAAALRATGHAETYRSLLGDAHRTWLDARR